MRTHLCGLWRATVVSAADPENRLRLRVVVPEFGTSPLPAWALGSVQPGVTAAPAAGDTVWVMFEKGDRDHPVWVGSVAGVAS